MINQTNQVMKKYGNNEEIDLKSLTFKKRQQFSGIRSSSLNHGAYPSAKAMAREMERTADTSPQVDNNPSNNKCWSYSHHSQEVI